MTGDFAVVGTGTGVGKTVVTAGLVGWLREEGVDATAVKPCQTGYPPDDDAAYVAEACGTDDAATCLRRLEPALAPAVAAEQVDAELPYDEIRAGCAHILEGSEVGVVEGIGGLRVPLAGGREVLDLVADLAIPVVIVARSGLGTLNHTALTVAALDRRSVPVSGVVLNEYEGATTAERTNPAVIERMTGESVATLPPLATGKPTAVVDGVRNHVPRSLVPAFE
ncbi:dethiobiotin synthase [Haloarcula salinisoli]|uniref:ATP-dependent dethiobiotin synthetase BioD n=1 Tax=Haloarcula salinisoli TaxID=2487746 RepID=A0A8J7YEH7_9EURY|nr:dethiobiotin synthase [Halomicroarcula salinisoli]MBX0286686.1 dethiobiotin synthase [Halomicroarcula salinisoli]MBX0303997.1 dethiobiotin synthase [Halomicroarcula salinisoli]